MGIFGQSEEKKKEKEVRQEAKGLTKELVNAGMDKNAAKNYLDVLQELVLEAQMQRDTYLTSKKRMASVLLMIEILLEDITEREPAKVRGDLARLCINLTDIFHECTIREDDMDFATTYQFIHRAAMEYEGDTRLMLQSELENLEHMIREIIEWEEPDFCALALFCKYGKREELADIENRQRNEMLLKYYRGQYWDDFEKELVSIGMLERVQNWIEKTMGLRS